MKKTKIIFLILIATVVTSFFILKTVKKNVETIINLTTEEKIADYEYLCDILNKSYPFWMEVEADGIDIEEVFDYYRETIHKSNTDIEFMKEIKSFLKEFQGYGHLSVLDGYQYQYYVNTINSSRGTLTESSRRWIDTSFAALFNPTSIKTYSMLDQSRLGFRSKKGLKDKYNKEITNEDVGEQLPSKDDNNLSFEIIEDGKIAYIKINTFEWSNIEKDRQMLIDFYKEVANYQHLIIDIQGNTGGSDSYWEDLIVAPNIEKPLYFDRYYLINNNNFISPYLEARFDKSQIHSIETLPKFENLSNEVLDYFDHYIVQESRVKPMGEILFNGDIWVLIDESNYSSAENFLIFTKNTEFATLVGKPTGGDGGVDPILFSLPNSGLIIRFSMLYGLNNDGTGNEARGTLPDIEVSENNDALTESLLHIK
ncbi:S41 family peptidase [Alkaliphilus serpentinus]|nr:S41 family peptidase [Alkaliphilus serpentinus]